MHKLTHANFLSLQHQMDPSSNFYNYRTALRGATQRSITANSSREKVSPLLIELWDHSWLQMFINYLNITLTFPSQLLCCSAPIWTQCALQNWGLQIKFRADIYSTVCQIKVEILSKPTTTGEFASIFLILTHPAATVYVRSVSLHICSPDLCLHFWHLLKLHLQWRIRL